MHKTKTTTAGIGKIAETGRVKSSRIQEEKHCHEKVQNSNEKQGAGRQ